MKQLVILSGKGGTGKTSLAAALASLAAADMKIVLVDADVDAANLELITQITRLEETPFWGGKVATIDPALCTSCGICEEICRFEAIHHSDNEYRIDPISCEGCDACVYQCPVSAIQSEEQQAGVWFRSSTPFGALFHAHLFAGMDNSGKLVTTIKQRGRQEVLDNRGDLLLVDGPPGIGCPVISATAGADFALLVVEPSVSAIHDLERILETVRHFGVPALVVINKADLNPTNTRVIRVFCKEHDVGLVGEIPFDTVVTESMAQGLVVTEYRPDSAVSRSIRGIWQELREQLSLG